MHCWPESRVKHVQECQCCTYTDEPVGGAIALPAGYHFLGLSVQGRVEAQAQAEQSAGVSEQAGEGAGAHADPVRLAAVAPCFLQTPEQVHTRGAKEEEEEESQGEEEQGGEEVEVQAGIEDPAGTAQGFCHQDAWEEEEEGGEVIYIVLVLKWREEEYDGLLRKTKTERQGMRGDRVYIHYKDAQPKNYAVFM